MGVVVWNVSIAITESIANELANNHADRGLGSWVQSGGGTGSTLYDSTTTCRLERKM